MCSCALQVKALKYQRRKLRYGLLSLDPKLKKKKPELAEDESDIDDEWIAQYEDESREKEIEKARKKFEKDNEKKVADGEEATDESVLDSRIEKINEEYDRLKEERGTMDAEIKGKKGAEQIEAAIAKLDERIQTVKFQMVDREEGKEIALGTR
jgi:DNA topoisomerase I